MKGLIVLSAGRKVSFEATLRGGGGWGGEAAPERVPLLRLIKTFRFESEVDAHVTIFLAEIIRLLLPLSSLPIAK